MDWTTLQWVREYLKRQLVNASQYSSHNGSYNTHLIVVVRDMVHDIEMKITELERASLGAAGYGE